MYTDKGFTKLDEVVLKAIADLQITTLHPYVWFLHYAIDGLRKLNYNIYPIYKELFKEMPANKMIPYPDDMVGWLRLGYQDGDRIVAFINDTSIVRSAKNPEDDTPYIPTELVERLRTSDVKPTDYMVYVHGHNTVGYFKDNTQKRRFEFSADTWANEIYIQYIGSCQTPNTETEIPTVAVDFLVSYVHYRNARFRLGASNRETEYTRREMQREAAELRALVSDLSYEGVVQAMQRSMTMATKY